MSALIKITLEPSKAPLGRVVAVILGLYSHVRQMRSFAGYIALIGDIE